jgi:alpha-L-fucosidase
MKINGDSIYGTSASPLQTQPAWGRVTRKGDTLYLHVFNWPAGGKLDLTGLNIKQAFLLADKDRKALVIDPASGSSPGQIELPAKPLDPIDTVIVAQL